jgi:predicted ATPase/class 3 adenylate cyclase
VIIGPVFMGDLPTGTVTLLFADVEQSTALLLRLGAKRYSAALAEYQRVVRQAVESNGGVQVDAEGDGFFAAFSSAEQAVSGAAEAQAALAEGGLHVRMGMHTGEPLVVDGRYRGIDVHQAARVAAAGHGEQVLLSEATRNLLDASVRVRDLGRHRLKDLGEPMRLYQLGDGDFPPPRGLDSTNLPVQPTPLIGREHELQVAGLLLRTHRIVTLTGPGGSGKTRVALQLAANAVDDFPGGVVWVPLQALRDSELVLPTIARALGTAGGSEDRSGDRRVLLVLDNFEQLLDAAPRVADLAAELPRLKLLITSRQPLHVSGEHEYPVLPLSEQEAVTLFVERANAVKPDFVDDGAVVEICRKLDCLPLALELAAARVKVLSATELLKRLDRRLSILTGGAKDWPERQRTLRATIAWSYDLLSEDEQQLFARLGVFNGGCTLEAAETVCEADLEAVAGLVDKSLLRREDDRYVMLDTIGEYALERLHDRGEEEQLRRRHAEYYLEQARSVERLIRSPRAARALDRLERDHANLRLALRWLSGVAQEGPLRLTVWGLAARLHGLGDQALDRRSAGDAERFYRESLELGLQLRDEQQVVYCLAGLAAVDAQRGRLNQAARLWGSVVGFERKSGASLHDAERHRYERVLSCLERDSHTSPDFADGTAMELDEAVEYALANVE